MSLLILRSFKILFSIFANYKIKILLYYYKATMSFQLKSLLFDLTFAAAGSAAATTT